LRTKIAIGLSGFKRSGKTTVKEVIEKYLKENLGLVVQEIMMADHLKNVCAILCETPRFHMDDQAYKEVLFDKPIVITSDFLTSLLTSFEILTFENLHTLSKHRGVELESPRHALQYIGTNVLREIDPDIHLKIALKQAKDHDAVIFTDCRFKNESDGVRGLESSGFTVIQAWVDRPVVTKETHALYERGELHFSEAAMFEFSATLPEIRNDGSLEDLKKRTYQTLIPQLNESNQASE